MALYFARIMSALIGFSSLVIPVLALGAKENYVSNQACGQCHQEAYVAWQGSHHEKAMQHATAETVLGDFNDATFVYFDLTSRFFKNEEKFFVNTEGPDGKLYDYEIKYTFGIEPLQQYLIEFPNGRLQSLTIAWDTKEKRWFHLYPNERIQADDPLHWTKLYQNWNMMCGDCHTTNYQKNYDEKTDTYTTTWSELNVSCQSCHGPGADHVSWAKQRAAGETYQLKNAGFVVDLKKADNKTQVELCGLCHSRRSPLTADHRPGDSLLDGYLPATLRPDLYHADGQILDEVYVYGSFVQSKMYRAGVRCTDCHDAHSLNLKEQGNAVCTKCHRADPPARFSTLKGKNYDTDGHHFHPAQSEGAQCVNCHMPSKNYMVVDPRRDHSMRIPRPDVAANVDSPDACSGCHDDQTPTWAAQKIKQWYEKETAPTNHFSAVLAAARAGEGGAQDDLIALALDGEQSVIVRATATELLQPRSRESVQALVDLAFDEEPWLRYAAIGALEQLPPTQRFPAVVTLLNDPLSIVRGEAARVLADVPAERFNDKQADAFRKALTDYRGTQQYLADTPSAQLNLGVLNNKLGDASTAQQNYERALSLDPFFLPARFNLANLYNTIGENEKGVAVLQQGIDRFPDNGELYYSLGLLLAEMKQMNASTQALGKAADLLNDRARVRYNYALALQGLERNFEAAAELRKAYKIDNRAPDIVYALAVFHAQQAQWQDALPYAQQLVNLVPNAPGPRQMLNEIQQRARER